MLNLSLLRKVKDMPVIKTVIPNDDHTLLIELSNHHRIIYDMKPRLKSIRFCGLADLKEFQSFRVEHGNTLVWNNQCQITIDEIINMIER